MTIYDCKIDYSLMSCLLLLLPVLMNMYDHMIAAACAAAAAVGTAAAAAAAGAAAIAAGLNKNK